MISSFPDTIAEPVVPLAWRAEMLRLIDQKVSEMISEHQASAAEIHAALDESADEELRRAERVLEYRNLYPGHAFLTRGQVKKMCLKYRLVMAPDFMFAGNIPEKNRQEREAFRLHEKHADLHIEPEEFALAMPEWRRGNYECVAEVPDDQSAPFLLPVGGDFALYSPDGFHAFRLWAQHCIRGMTWGDQMSPLIPVVRTSAGFVRLHGMVMPIEIELRHDIEDNPFVWSGVAPRSTWTVRFHFHIPPHWRDSAHVDDVCQMVVCPPDMLQKKLAIERMDGWEIVFSPRAVAPLGRGADPIILQPVNGGFLVVTKWDAEALLPEVAGQTN